LHGEENSHDHDTTKNLEGVDETLDHKEELHEHQEAAQNLTKPK
jgi:hypothetical protein